MTVKAPPDSLSDCSFSWLASCDYKLYIVVHAQWAVVSGLPCVPLPSASNTEWTQHQASYSRCIFLKCAGREGSLRIWGCSYPLTFLLDCKHHQSHYWAGVVTLSYSILAPTQLCSRFKQLFHYLYNFLLFGFTVCTVCSNCKSHQIGASLLCGSTSVFVWLSKQLNLTNRWCIQLTNQSRGCRHHCLQQQKCMSWRKIHNIKR